MIILRGKARSCFFINMATLILLLLILTTPSEAATSQQDVGALSSLHKAWLGNPLQWDFSTDPCDDQWLGIGCDPSQTRVTQMILINNGLTGTLSSAIGNLTELSVLDLSSNANLGGPLPAEIGYLTNLQNFFIQFCNFSGSIPHEVGNMVELNYLGLSSNSFSGDLPGTIGRLEKLIYLDVSTNNLSGQLPVSSTSGIGIGLDNLTNAQHFHLQENGFSGTIPPSLFNQKMQLIHLLLSKNKLNGSIPSTIGDLSHLEILCLDFNAFSGRLPSTINDIVNLTTLQTNNNQFDGQLTDISNNTKLQMLMLGNNPFDASTIPSWITKLTKLYLVSMDSANLIGTIPAELFGFSSTLSNVTLASNQLNGTLDLTEASSSSLLLVNVTNNAIVNIKGSYTKELLLSGNPYCNSNPSSTECTAMQASTPPAMSNSTADASPCTNTDCPSPSVINRKSCKCAHPVVSTCIFYATKVPVLKHNISDIEDIFRDGLSNSKFLQGLSFPDTQIVVDPLSSSSVQVYVFPPGSMKEWPPRNSTLISYVLQNQDIEFPLIGPKASDVRTPNPQTIVVHKLSTGAIVGIIIGAITFSIVILVLAAYAMKLRKRALKAETLNKPFAAWIAAGQEDNGTIPRLKGARWFSLDEIRKCTNNFSRSNEIGEGGYGKVYRGFLSSGDRVAIKRASANSLQGTAEFKNEIELLSRVHHRNLVGLIGFCFEEGEQMLVYEYMPNGTLRECLSGQSGARMDWHRRMELVLDSARGIVYLHTEANPPIIHRDIKSSNILLDEKLVAKVADFGLSKLAPDGGGFAIETSQVKGTIGYLDPNYYRTYQLTNKSDVYSFGVVLLEVITGRLPNQGGRYIVHEVTKLLAKGGMDLVVQELVDPDLEEYPQKALERLFEIALACVKEEPAERPLMVEVVREVEALKQTSSADKRININMGEEHSDLYGQGLPYMQQSYETSLFEYTGSFEGMSQPLQPK